MLNYFSSEYLKCNLLLDDLNDYILFIAEYTGLDKHNSIFKCKIVNIFLPISFNIYFGCSKEPSHWDGYFEYPQHMFWLRNKKNIFWYALFN